MTLWRLAVGVVLGSSPACATKATPPVVSPPLAVSVRSAPDVQTPERYTVEADDGHRVIVWHKAPARAQGTIVLVHGRTWSSRPDFDLQVPGEQRSLMDALSARGWATFAVDLRGYGETARDASGWLTPDRAAQDVVTVLRWTANRTGHTPALLGWSMGSLVAQLCAQQHPALVSDLILYGYPRDPDGTHPVGPSADQRPAMRPTTAQAAAEDFIVREAVTPATAEAFVAAALAADPVRADWRATEQFRALDPTKVNVPTLVLHGEHDPYAPIAHQAKLFARLQHPDRVWVVLAGGDHAAHLETTGPRFVHAVVEFLERPRPTG